MKTFSFKTGCLAGLFFICSCVPVRKYEELKDRNRDCETERNELKAKSQDLDVQTAELESEVTQLRKRVKALAQDTSVMGTSYRRLTSLYDKIQEQNKELLAMEREKAQNNEEESAKILKKYQLAQEDLQRREDQLRQLEKSLEIKKNNIENMKAELDKKRKELNEKQKRVTELEELLARKDNQVNELKDKLSEALVGFEGEGLTIEIKNGKVYVSLEEKLLFETGSFKVGKQGKEALKKLAKVLEKNEDINIMIEGHTDDVPYNGSGQLEDNWDLSVKRATTIVRIIVENSKIDPKRLTACGRGEHSPVDPGKSREARQKNRRTEIILTPKLGELYQILNN